MPEKKSAEVVSEIVELLSPLESDERHRVVQASLILLGEAVPTNTHQKLRINEERGEEIAGGATGISDRAQVWMKQNSVSLEELQQVFHLDNGSADIIAGGIPGKNNKDKTCNAYILVGLSTFLKSGNATLDDKSARALCESAGCYDLGNHAYYIKNRGNEFTGTKDKGWTLTAPGLKRAATLIKEIATS